MIIAAIASFVARAISSVPSQLFCYNSITSASIVHILPGYYVLTGSLEIGSKSMINGSAHLVFSLVYAIFLTFALQMGSDSYLFFDPEHRAFLHTISGKIEQVIELTGIFAAPHGTSRGLPEYGTFIFTNRIDPAELIDWNNGCYRPAEFPWWAQPFPQWALFLTVPMFVTVLALANGQPWKHRDFIAMILIGCITFATNLIADYLIFERTDIVAFIGAFMCATLGNMYERYLGGNAFVVMVPGILLLLPSGLALSGGITAEPDMIALCSAMVMTTISITTGIFMAIATVSALGKEMRTALSSF